MQIRHYLRFLIVHPALEIHAALGVVLVAHHLRVHAGQIEVGGALLATAGEDHLGFGGLAQQGLHDRLDR